jgi:soluble lytic murein transglycosylase-like protein
MRGIDATRSRFPAARAFLAGVALLAGATATKAYAETKAGHPQAGTDEIAMAVPRVSPYGASGVALPQPLAPSEAARIRRIFALQAKGDIPAAIRDTSTIDTASPLGAAMLGEVLADRYLGRFTRPQAPELRVWLERWSALPEARAIHALLLIRLPRGEKPPPPPPVAALPHPASTNDDDSAAGIPVPEESEPAGRDLARNPATDRAVLAAAREKPQTAAARVIARTKGLPGTYAAQLRGEAARILFTLNQDEQAHRLGAAGVHACKGAGADCQEAALPGYVAGLAAWRMGKPALARPMFEAAWRAEYTTSALRAGAAFWAARSHLALGDIAGYVRWMHRAGQEKTTFYGLIARRTEGLSVGLNAGPRETLGEADLEAVEATTLGKLAFALLQVGQRDRAEAALRLLWPQAQALPPLGRAIMLVAERAGMPNLAAQLADLVQTADGTPRDAVRFAVPKLRPTGGFSVDPAMIYALARTESNFDPTLVSSAGARGLMQIMPATARFIAHDEETGADRIQLHDPAVNLDLGQRYVAYLAAHDAVAGNLIHLLASYNSGPGNFGRWGTTVRDLGDPLLFIEAVPIDETRAFIPRVLAYTWIYAARLRLPAPSLDELAAGAWPRYHPLQMPQGAPVRVQAALH